MPAPREKAQPSAWLAWALVLGAAGLTLYGGCGAGRTRGVIALAATRLAPHPPPSRYQAMDDAILGASQRQNLYLQMRWPPAANEAMHELATSHWYRGSYVLYPLRLWVASVEPRADAPETLPVNAPLPSAEWLAQAQVGGILELTWDGTQPQRRRQPLPTRGPAQEAAP